MLNRIVGLETEYAIGDPDSGPTARHRFLHYRAIVAALRKRLPLAVAKHFKDGVFLANGGAVWFESERPSTGSGLIEGSTAECRGVMQVVTYQRAQDRLLAASAADAVEPFWLLKNDRDAKGNIYGAQENYEAILASGLRLGIWRAGLLLLFPLAVATWAVFLGLILLLVAYFIVLGLLRPMFRDQPALVAALYGRPEMGAPTPAWLEPVLLWVIRVVNAPLAIGLWLLCSTCAFRRARRDLTALLASRSILCGAGMLDEAGEFHLADKARGINCRVGFGGYLHDRPLFTMGHFFKTLCIESMFSPRDFWGLFRQRQRLQIGLGDSNMADVAEFLRVGTTMLVLDAIESGQLRSPPRLRQPLRALHNWAADPSLQTTQATRRHGLLSAIDMQRWYLQACREYVYSQDEEVDSEAWQILRYWSSSLDALQRYAEDQVAPAVLLGQLDWVTKQHLLDECDSDDWSVRKKIDLRYHETSPDGYFERLRNAQLTVELIDRDHLQKAQRTPPVDTPASGRGRLIREFSGDRNQVQANWSRVIITEGKSQRVIRLRDPGAPAGRQVRPRRARDPQKT